MRTGIDVADPWAAIEACYAAGWTDGLPVVPPTDALVDAMLAAGPWKPEEILLHEPVRDRRVTAEKAAINSVMAGCRPDYFPVVGAALLAIGDAEFLLHGPATSTGGSALMVIVNGPVRARLGVNSSGNLFGPGVRANATIGRTLRLVLLNCLECRPGVLDRSTQGWPGKYSLCFAEDEASSPWEPLSVSRGVAAGRSAVTVYAAESGHNVLSHGTGDVERLLTCFADAMASLGSLSPGRSVIVFAPEHATHLRRSGWTRGQVQQWLYDHAWRSLADLKRGGKVEPAFFTNPSLVDWLFRDAPGGPPDSPPAPETAEEITAADEAVRVHRGHGPDDILLAVGGGEAGGHSAFFPSWSRGRSVPFVTKEVPE
ncbi:MAG TPA: hypothetical protein VML54_16645 [Candidatus Limnocylindrales bacterium]|nr:hypothetical protein [Candidatus Limnocylindrales bacterium]